MTIDGASVGAPSPGLQLLLERLWRQEITHQHVLAELFHNTDLARALGLWAHESRPGVVIEPERGIFDLALLDGAGTAGMYIELKFAAASGWATQVLYIGKATTGTSGRSGLRKRVGQLLAYGSGKPVGHQGGRYVWQVAGSDEFLVAWQVVNDPTAEENRLLAAFFEIHHAYQFANIAGPRT